jgi:hypothetical protein
MLLCKRMLQDDQNRGGVIELRALKDDRHSARAARHENQQILIQVRRVRSPSRQIVVLYAITNVEEGSQY